MNSALAESILVQIMGWNQDQISKERPLIQAMGNFKYDEYQQFSPGRRFTESLVNWLNQFQTIEERNTAYDFLKSHLIFITSEQINHLIEISFQEKIDPLLTQKAAELLSLPYYHTTKIHNNSVYKEVKRQSIFLGLSDGARIDQLRRFAKLDNEQVFSSYHISSEKIRDLLEELKKKLDKDCKFTTVFLIDDFTASGLSYLRPEEGEGKLLRFIDKIFQDSAEQDLGLKELLEQQHLELHILFYLATKKALEYISGGIEAWKLKNNYNFKHTVSAVQEIGPFIWESVINNAPFAQLISQEKYFDESIIDRHYKKGKIDKPYLGFDECALPLILNHNTPNNSLPILWFPSEEGAKIEGLFPRVTRHKE
ncbi:MAG: hypothetical protein JST82_13820 [Bacteroidetes bacterium]|nr:hypothetical protein [Bacteroidota bacterium]